MNKNTALMIGGGILVLGVGFFIYKKIKAKRKYSMGTLDNSQGQGSSYSNGGSNSGGNSGGGFDPSNAARLLKKSMEGVGTDDDLFWETTNALSKDERKQVKVYFDTNFGDLEDWIEGDFAWGDEKKALAKYDF